MRQLVNVSRSSPLNLLHCSNFIDDVSLFSLAKSSLPIVRQAEKTEKVAAENQLDRMTLWIKSVESEYYFNILYLVSMC